MTKEIEYKIVAIVIENGYVKAKELCLAPYYYNEAIQVIKNMTEFRNKNDKFGTITNPLRYEGRSKYGKIVLDEMNF